jgi:hypothetical protein
VLYYEITVSTGAQVKNLISSFLPFSTASTLNVTSARNFGAVQRVHPTAIPMPDQQLDHLFGATISRSRAAS